MHATPVGRDNDDLPFEIDELSASGVVVDLAYGPQPTSLVVKSRALGHVTIDGRDVLLVQVVRQFQVITGTDMPAHLAREIIGMGVGAHNNATQE